MSYITYTTIQMAMPTSKSFALWRILHDSFRVPCTLVHHQIYTHPSIRSGLLTFFSSLVIQESLINFAGERRRSKTSPHCELVFVFCLSASYPSSWVRKSRDSSLSRFVRTTLQVAYGKARTVIVSERFCSHPVVELAIAEMACVSRNVRTTRSESLPAFRSNVPFLNAMSRILVVLQILHLSDWVVFFLEAIDDLLKGVFWNTCW